jgi:hypothetical protein
MKAEFAEYMSRMRPLYLPELKDIDKSRALQLGASLSKDVAKFKSNVWGLIVSHQTDPCTLESLFQQLRVSCSHWTGSLEIGSLKLTASEIINDTEKVSLQLAFVLHTEVSGVLEDVNVLQNPMEALQSHKLRMKDYIGHDMYQVVGHDAFEKFKTQVRKEIHRHLPDLVCEASINFFSGFAARSPKGDQVAGEISFERSV